MHQSHSRISLWILLGLAAFHCEASAEQVRKETAPDKAKIGTCVAVDEDSPEALSGEACAVNVRPNRHDGDETSSARHEILAAGASEAEAIKPMTMEQLRKAVGDLNTSDDALVACEGSSLSITGEVNRTQNLVITTFDVKSIRTDPTKKDNGAARVILELCPVAAGHVRAAKRFSDFIYYGDNVPLVNQRVAINAAGEIHVERDSVERAELEVELFRRTCMSECSDN